jgi:hypothetical protein
MTNHLVGDQFAHDTTADSELTNNTSTSSSPLRFAPLDNQNSSPLLQERLFQSEVSIVEDSESRRSAPHHGRSQVLLVLLLGVFSADLLGQRSVHP